MSKSTLFIVLVVGLGLVVMVLMPRSSPPPRLSEPTSQPFELEGHPAVEELREHGLEVRDATPADILVTATGDRLRVDLMLRPTCPIALSESEAIMLGLDGSRGWFSRQEFEVFLEDLHLLVAGQTECHHDPSEVGDTGHHDYDHADH